MLAQCPWFFLTMSWGFSMLKFDVYFIFLAWLFYWFGTKFNWINFNLVILKLYLKLIKAYLAHLGYWVVEPHNFSPCWLYKFNCFVMVDKASFLQLRFVNEVLFSSPICIFLWKKLVLLSPSFAHLTLTLNIKNLSSRISNSSKLGRKPSFSSFK